MMIEEFATRTGYKPTFEEYAKIERQYYDFDGDKDEFCQYWQCHNIARRVIMQAILYCVKQPREDKQIQAALKEYYNLISKMLF